MYKVVDTNFKEINTSELKKHKYHFGSFISYDSRGDYLRESWVKILLSGDDYDEIVERACKLCGEYADLAKTDETYGSTEAQRSHIFYKCHSPRIFTLPQKCRSLYQVSHSTRKLYKI